MACRPAAARPIHTAVLLLVCRLSHPQARASLLSPGLCHSRTYMQHLSILHKPLPFQRLSWHLKTIVSSVLSETRFPDGCGCYA